MMSHTHTHIHASLFPREDDSNIVGVRVRISKEQRKDRRKTY